MPEAASAFELWRQDDNGQRFMVERFACRSAAESRLVELVRRVHKQIYWVEEIADEKIERRG
ncbi:hypothetical protein [Trichloromonas sp.]|uniref:hypothetical protein n=1 Tax=Trichloromonas sp. TaxID=3069249 RepID=UPI003D819995